MALQEGVKIEIISNGNALPMYDDPDVSEMDLTSTSQHYVEAVTGATFSIRVILTSTFQKGPCDAVRVVVNFDGAPTSFYQDICKQGYNPLLREANFSSITTRDSSTGHWINGSFCFARLDTKETNDSTGVKIERVQSLGKIKISITRIILLGIFDTSLGVDMKRVSELPEKMLKGKAIDNTIDLTDTFPSTAPPQSERMRPIEGPLSKPLVVNILYRSRRSLQILGCIPRSPSPESLTGSPDPKEEIQQLRERLALLERDTNVKAEPRNARGSIKRERQEADAQRSPKKSRRTGSIEVVDLTAD